VLHYSADLNDQLKSLSLGLIENPKLLNSETTKNDAGKLVTEIRFGGDGGWGKLHITGDTHVLTDMQMEFQPKGQNPGGVVKVKGVFKPEIMDKLPTRIMFDTAGRKEVGSISDLVPDAPPQVGLPKVGADAPDFTLKTLSGEEITLSKLKGSVVVLDFWATWCGPCRKGLPFVQKFSDWAAESGKPIKVFAVDVWEHEETEAARKAAAEKFWTASKYTMPTLLDLDSKVGMQYGVPSIPTTIIIDANGKPNGIMGVPADYKPASSPLITQGQTTLPANAPTNTVGSGTWSCCVPNAARLVRTARGA
jgi:thiol-disulfide isomerase/thioredoxin